MLPAVVPDIDALRQMLADGSAALHRAMLRDLPGAAFAVYDPGLRILFAEGAELRRRGLDPELDLVGCPIPEAFPEEFDAARASLQAALEGGETDVELVFDDRVIWLHTAPVHGSDGVIGGLAIAADVTERFRANAQLRLRMTQQAAVATLGRRALEGVSVSRLLEEAAPLVAEALGVDRVSIVRYDGEAGIMTLAAGVGWAQELVRRAIVPIGEQLQPHTEALAAGPRIVHDLAADEQSVYAPLRDVLLSEGVSSLATVMIGGGGRLFGTLTALTLAPRAFSSEDADFLHSMANVLWDAIERHEAETANEHAALHDPLTGLPNRRMLLERLDRALERARHTRSGVAVVLLDLDNFKVINDSLGHTGGDELLHALTPRLLEAARDCDTVARLGGDEFVLVCEGVLGDEHALELARRVERALAAPFVIRGRHHVVKSSIGIVIDDGTSTPEDLLRDADTALYRAKENGRARCEVFSPVMRVRAIARLRTETELQGAAERGELRVHYQPLYEIAQRRLVGMEALVRWERPDHGLVPPNEFIPVAEETGLIVSLGDWVLNAATAQVAEWQAEIEGADELGIAVNVSGRQLLVPGFEHTVASALARSGLPAHRLSLEVTESMLMEQTDTPISTLAELQRLGTQIVLDDFGTGYSSLSRLKDLPLDVLKIDRSFIDRLGDDADREPIVVAIIAMARALGLEVVAEGVETERALQRLSALRCQVAQGFLLARPIPSAQMTELLRRELADRAPLRNVVPLRRAPGA